ncbi:tetratricopeptide repeat protein [bacterium AH-315-J04]|nr:tetratricopeptide repeat protein [bacterium AH-315-J04]
MSKKMNSLQNTSLRRHAALYAGLMILSLGATGCQHSTMKQHKIKAERQWKQVRGRVQFQLAKQQFENGHFLEATRTAIESLALDPKDQTTYALLTKAFLELGKFASAEKTINTADLADIHSPELIYLRGVILEQRNQLTMACDLFEQARQAQPEQADFLLATAECLVSDGKAEQALAMLEDAKSKTDDSPAVCVLTARIAGLLGDTNRAIRQYRACAATATENPLVAASLGRLLVQADRHEEAIVTLTPLLDTEGATGDVLRNLAYSYLATGLPASAKSALATHTIKTPADVQAQLLFAQASLETNDMMNALQSLDRAMSHDPTNKQVRFLLATVQWQRKRYHQATNILQAFLNDYPEDVEAHCLMGELHTALANPDQANQHFQAALQLDPNNTWARRQLGS